MSHPQKEKEPGDVCTSLGQLSNEDWLASHRALIDSGAIPAEELGYLYDPDRDPDTVHLGELTADRDPKEPAP